MSGPIRLLTVSFLLLGLLGGCATLSPGFEEPTLQVNSIRLKNSNSLAPEFEISLRVTNPNRDDLSIDGMTYTLNLAGNKVVSGAANDLPTIPAYGEADVKIMATLSLLGGFKLLNDLMNQYQESVGYEIIVRLDVGKFYPRITIQREGVFTF
jgi:LEA14-like dessication related protein